MIWNEHSLWQRDPFSGLRDIQREMDRMFSGYAATAHEYPVMNAWGDELELHVEAELPGVDPSEVEIVVEDGVLRISGERKAEPVEGGNTTHLAEISYGTFERALRLPYDVAVDQVAASYKHGVLQVTLPRAEAARPQRIEVKS